MPVFAYQSLNSSTRTDRGVSASNFQRFTVDTHNNIAASRDRWMLAMPVAEGVAPDVPVYGPAQLLASAKQGYIAKGKHTDASFLKMVEGKARQSHQHLIRSLGQCSLMVYGEMDGSHGEWQSMRNHAGNLLGAFSGNGKACNSFSVHTNGSGNHCILGQGMGWVALKSDGIRALFVHVPNDDAKREDLTKKFYRDIQDVLLKVPGGGVIDVIIGDTNQPHMGYTERVASEATGQTFEEFHKHNQIQPEDAYQRSFGGTNSNAKERYDVAVFNTATVKIEDLVYLSQCTNVDGASSSLAAAVTDHMGIGIRIVKC